MVEEARNRSNSERAETFPIGEEFGFRFERVGVVNETPAFLGQRERLFLFAMVAATAPLHVIEIGTFKGGGAKLISSALSDIDRGRLASLDPCPEFREVPDATLGSNCVFVEGRSPENLIDARRAVEATNGFELALVDASHAFEDVREDLGGLMAHLADEAYVLLHDGYYDGVSRAISDALERSSCWVDGGMVVDCRNRMPDGDVYGGLYLLRFIRRADTPSLASL